MQDVLPPEVGRQIDEALRRVRATKAVVTVEYWLALPGGKQSFEGRLLALPDEQLIVIVRNITDRKRAEDAQRLLADAGRALASSLDYETTLQSLARQHVPALADWCAVEIQDDRPRQAAVAHVDPAKEEIARELGRRYPLDPNSAPLAEVQREGRSIILREVPDSFLAALARNAEHLELLRQLEVRSAMLVPLRARGRTLGTVIIAAMEPGRYGPEDLVLAAELARRAAVAVDNARLYREAQEAIRSRDEFLSATAHGLKTPLTSLRGFAQLMARRMEKGEAADPRQLEQAFRVIDRQSERLSRLVSQMVDVSLIEAGLLALRPQAVDLTALVGDIVAKAQATTARQALVLHAPPSAPAMIDPQRVGQVVRNLIDNAIKFGPEGVPIDVEVSTPDPQTVRLAVRDRGRGIAPECRPQIFQRFFQAQRGHPIGGMGLGLYVSRHIVELHGGRIEAEFPPDGGTRFVVTLPREPGSGGAEATVPPAR